MSAQQPLILAIDAGTTGVTALVVTQQADVVARGYQEFAQHFDHPGWVEHELADIWAATLAATNQAMATLGATGASGPTQIIGIGITNQRETVCLWDRETMGAARRAIVWQDRRTAPWCADHAAAANDVQLQVRTGLRLDPYFSGSKLTWIRDHDPQTWAQVSQGRVAIGTVDSYLIARMTRGLEHITDATNASRTLLYDLHSANWSASLCDFFGLPMDALPEVTASYGQLAHSDPSTFCGIDAPIAGIAGDQQAALVGQAALRPGAAKCTYGTGSFLLVNVGSDLAALDTARDTGLLTTVALQHPDGRRDFALEGAVFVTGAAVQWLRDGLGIIESAAQVEALARSVPDSGGVIFVPALTGLGAPDWDPTARGLVIGIERGTTRAHLARATLEAIAFEVADVVRLMEQQGNVRLPELRVDGGAAANDLLCQLQADVLGVPVDRSAELQTTGLGAAFLAGLGVGLWQSPADLQHTRQSSGLFTPDHVSALAGEQARARWRRGVDRALNWAID